MRVEVCRRRRVMLLRQIARLCHLPQVPRVQERVGLLIENYLNNQMVQLAVVDELLTDAHGEADRSERWAQQLSLLAAQRRYDRLRQPIEWFYKRKSAGDFRKVCDLPVGTKLFHSLAKDILTTVHSPREHIGDWPERGRDWTVQRLAEQLSRSPTQFAIVTDIRSCFASINPDALYQLPHLSERFIRIVLDSRSQRFVQKREERMDCRIGTLCISEREATPRGLLEGSPTSNAILAILLDDLADQFEPEVSVFVYCDNIVLVAANEEMAKRAGRALRRYVAAGRLGCLSLHQTGAFIRPVTEAFDLLGYSFRVRHDGYLRVDLSDKNSVKFLARLGDQGNSPELMFQRLHSSFPALSDECRTHFAGHIGDELGWRSYQSVS